MNSNEIKKSTLSGMFWKFFERSFAQLVSLVVSIILARLLLPEDYSVVSIVAIFFTFANIFISGGFSSALIQKKEADILDYSSVLYVSIFIALVMYALMFFLAPFISRIYTQPILIPIIRVMGITLIINAIKSVFSAYTSSHLQFKKFFYATFFGTIISAVVGICMAHRGFGSWALVAQQMTNSAIDTLILFMSTRCRFVFKISFQRMRELFSFGWKIFLTSIISTIYDEVNPLIIGLRFSPSDLAFYEKGRGFPSIISAMISDTFSSVLFPVMSKLQDDKEELLNYTRRFIGIASFFVFPMMLGFFAISDNFISLILTDKWMPAAIYVKIFCITYMFNIIQNGNLHVIKAMGRSDISLILEVIKKSSYAIVIFTFIMLSKQPEMLAIATIVNTCIALIVNTYPNRKLIGYSYKLQVLDVIPNLFSSIVMTMVVSLMNQLPFSKIVLLLMQIICGIVVYVVLNMLIKNQNMTYTISMLKDVFKRS
ncbi:MAG: lipopolysaccharide biosynthesis protein [Lachnospiraceae bacterium]